MYLDQYLINSEPFYRALGNEVLYFEAAYSDRLPIMLKGPTGCGKTRFIEHMAYTLNKPLITVSCHEDMTATDLVGRYLLDADGTLWHDGPLTLAVRHGGIRSEEHTSELQSRTNIVCRLLLEKKKINFYKI